MREPRPVGYSQVVLIFAVAVTLAIAAYAAPLVEVTKPADTSIVSGVADIEVTYTADGPSPIVRVEVLIDGRSVKDFRLEKPASQGRQAFRWDFSLATPSKHAISARAWDANGTVGSTGIQIVVQRSAVPAPAPGGSDRTAPTVDIYYPAEGTVVSGDVHVKADVSDNVGIRSVVFFLDGEFKKLMMNSPNYSYKTDTRKLADGPHVVAVTAHDEAENEGRSQVGFVVQNREATAPTTRVSRTVEATPIVLPEATPVPKPPVPTVTPPIEITPAPAVIAPAAPDASVSAVADGSASPVIGNVTAPATGPRTGLPTVAGLPQPKPVEAAPMPAEFTAPPASTAVAPAPRKPATSGLVAKLLPNVDTAISRITEPAAPPTAPQIDTPVVLKAPASPDVARIARALPDATPARIADTATVASSPKTSQLDAADLVVLAPAAKRDDERIAALPERDEDARPQAKIGMPGQLDVAAMSRFRDVKIVFDGKLIPLRTAPTVVDGISIAPLREIFESCDGVLYWTHADKRVKAVNSDVEMNLQIGNPVINVNGTAEELMLAPYISNGRTMLPLEFVAGMLDVTVSFNSNTGELVISAKD